MPTCTGGPARLLAAQVAGLDSSCSTRRISTRVRAIRTPARTARTGPTTRCASRRSPPLRGGDRARCRRRVPSGRRARARLAGRPRAGVPAITRARPARGHGDDRAQPRVPGTSSRAICSARCGLPAERLSRRRRRILRLDRLPARRDSRSPTASRRCRRPTPAEIRTPEGGMGLDGLLRQRADVLSGILNGIDIDVWNPAHDPHLRQRLRCQAASRCARRTRPRCRSDSGLTSIRGAFVFGVVSRLTWQKGLDLLPEVLPALDVDGRAARPPRRRRPRARKARSPTRRASVPGGWPPSSATTRRSRT